MENKKKIAFFAYRSTHGGSIKMSVWLTNSLSDFYDVTYVNFSDEKVYYPLSEKVRLIEFRGKSKYYKYREITRSLNKEKYDVIINFGDRFIYYLGLIRCVRRLFLIISQRSDPSVATRLQDLFKLRVSYSVADFIVCQTNDVVSYFEKGLTASINKTVIPNPVVNMNERKIWRGSNGMRIICVARVYLKQKRQDLLVDTMRIIKDKYPECILEFYGADVDGNVEVLKNYINERALENNIKYMGVCSDIKKLMAEADILVLASDFEGIPNSLIEGMDVGIPIVATDCDGGGVRFLLGDNTRGLIANKGDVKELASCIINVIEDKESALQRSNCARDFLKSMSEDIIIDKWRRVIENNFI